MKPRFKIHFFNDLNDDLKCVKILMAGALNPAAVNRIAVDSTGGSEQPRGISLSRADGFALQIDTLDTKQEIGIRR